MDNTKFSDKEAKDQLNALHSFFSFVKGFSCRPICAVGYDSSGNPIWEGWSAPTESTFSSSFSSISWFDRMHSDQMEKLFLGFMKCWFKERWNDTFQKVIYWYYNANTSKKDAGIILAQTALERLF